MHRIVMFSADGHSYPLDETEAAIRGDVVKKKLTREEFDAMVARGCDTGSKVLVAAAFALIAALIFVYANQITGGGAMAS